MIYLRKLRLRRRLTQAGLARLARMTRQVVCDLEKGRRGLGAKRARRLAEVLDCTLEELL